MTNIKFKAELGQVKCVTEYLKEERSFMFQTNRRTVSLMIGHQYLSLEVDCHQQSVTGISGYFDIELCKTGHVSHLNFEENTLAKIVSESLLLECGFGYDYKIIGETIFDPISKRLLVGTIDENAKVLIGGQNVLLGLSDSQIVYVQIENMKL